MYKLYGDPSDYRFPETRIYLLMHHYSKTCKEKIDSICHPLFSTDIAKSLAYAFQNEDENALNVCDCLRIGGLELSAIIEDFDWFKEELMEKEQDAALSAAETCEA
jgi:hypothetical protein